MNFSRQNLGDLLRAAAVLLLIGAGVTLIPWTNPMVSDLGYHTLCPFAPWSTLTLLFLSGTAHVVRRYLATLPTEQAPTDQAPTDQAPMNQA